MGETVHACFGRRVAQNARQRAKGTRRGYIQNHALALRGHMLANDLAREDCAEQIQIEDKPERFFGNVKKGEIRPRGCLWMISSCAIDETIYPSKLLNDSLRSLLQFLQFEGVTFED